MLNERFTQTIWCNSANDNAKIIEENITYSVQSVIKAVAIRDEAERVTYIRCPQLILQQIDTKKLHEIHERITCCTDHQQKYAIADEQMPLITEAVQQIKFRFEAERNAYGMKIIALLCNEIDS